MGITHGMLRALSHTAIAVNFGSIPETDQSCFVLHCCNSRGISQPSLTSMLTSQAHLSSQYSRSFRARLVALLLLVAQVSSLLIVPLHAIAHGQVARASDATTALSTGTGAVNRFSSLFGHEQGFGCDDWNAAFALDSHSGHSSADLPAVLLTATGIVGCLPVAPPATSFRPFLARAPPRH